jgi:hypothetical protein
MLKFFDRKLFVFSRHNVKCSSFVAVASIEVISSTEEAIAALRHKPIVFSELNAAISSRVGGNQEM